MGTQTPGEGYLGELEATKSTVTVNKEEEKVPLSNLLMETEFINRLCFTQSQLLALNCYKKFTI